MEYKGLIFTNHILERMKERDLRYEDIYWIFNNPDKILDGKTNGSKKCYRNWKGMRYAIVAKKNEQGKWVMLTCWWKELKDKRFKAKSIKNEKMGFWKRVWKMIAEK